MFELNRALDLGDSISRNCSRGSAPRFATSCSKRVDYLRIVARNLRQKLEADASRPALIRNEPGVGYRLVAAQPDRCFRSLAKLTRSGIL